MCCFVTTLDCYIKFMAILAATVATSRVAQTAINAFAKGRFNYRLRCKTLSDGNQECKYFMAGKSQPITLNGHYGTLPRT
jgi:hypothetical protein